MPDRIPSLQKALVAVEGALDTLMEKVSLDEATLRRLKRLTVVLTCSVIFDVALTVLVGWGLAGVTTNQARINELQSSVQQEADRSRTAQCAVITLFLQFEPKTLANPAYTDEQKALQTQAYTTLTQIAKDLECNP